MNLFPVRGKNYIRIDNIWQVKTDIITSISHTNFIQESFHRWICKPGWLLRYSRWREHLQWHCQEPRRQETSAAPGTSDEKICQQFAKFVSYIICQCQLHVSLICQFYTYIIVTIIWIYFFYLIPIECSNLENNLVLKPDFTFYTYINKWVLCT